MSQPTVAVIGTGFSGLTAAIQLKKKLGIVAQVYEGTKDIGGTWNYNTYPGCACDIPSHLYSFSFELNPNWSRKYSPQKEIHEYMQGVARKYNVYEQTQFETKVVRASWIEDKKKWELELHQPTVHKENQIRYFDFVFGCIGGLRVPNVPKQFQAFEGKIIHSAYWDNDFDFNNKSVAVIGSGTSAIQIVPNLAPRVKHLHSFQRTPTWVGPRNQLEFSSFIQFVFAYVPFVMLIYRTYLFYIRDFNFSAWGDVNSKRAKFVRDGITMHMTHVLNSNNRPDLVEKLIPNFPVGCKRIGISDDYVQSLCAENVTVNTSTITNIRGRTITTADSTETEVDVLCLATGFDVDGFLGELQINGRDGVNLNKLWDDHTAKTYKTLTVHGFPNYFTLLGPGSALGHNSIIAIIESQIDYCIKMMSYMIKNRIICLDPTEKAQDTFSSDLQSRFKGTVWRGGCDSWYINKHGDIQTLWPSTVTSFINMLKYTDYDANFIKN
ncbi:unnamed protein product [Mucor circinelloides]